MKPFGMIGLAALFTVAGTSLASAQEAFTTGDINMRAGPSTRFPVVETIPEGRPVVIHGCLANFDWCDVSWRRERGWVFSEYLEYVYAQRPVEFYEYRRRVGVPVISFSFGYWDRYYRNRPWFDEWDYWGDDRRRDRVRNDRRDRRDDDRDNVADRDRRDDDNRNRARLREDDNRNQARNRNRNDYDEDFDRTGSTTRADDECFDQQGNNRCNDDQRSQRRIRDGGDEQGNRRRGNNDGFGEGEGGINN